MKALVVGVDSQIGSALATRLRRSGAEVLGTSRRRTAPAGSIALDLSEPDGLGELPACDAAFLCAAETSMAVCEADPERTRRINVTAPVELGRRLAARGTFVVFLSSSAVFGGRVPHCAWDAPPTPSTVYGEQKAAAEREVLELGGAAAVFRPTKVLTPQMPLFRSWMDALRAGASITPFSDLVLAPLPVDLVTRALELIAQRRASGIFQASGAREITYAEAACHIAVRLGAAPDLVRPIGAASAGISAGARPPFQTLDASRLKSLFGLSRPDPFDVLDSVFGLAAGAPARDE